METVCGKQITACSEGLTVDSRKFTACSEGITANSERITACSERLTVCSRTFTVSSERLTARLKALESCLKQCILRRKIVALLFQATDESDTVIGFRNR